MQFLPMMIAFQLSTNRVKYPLVLSMFNYLFESKDPNSAKFLKFSDVKGLPTG